MSTTPLPRPGHLRRGVTASALALGLALATGSPVLAATGPEDADDAGAVAVSGEPCETTGVDVVVDFPAADPADDAAAGGEVRLGCAPEAGVTGTEALNAAGFTDTRDAATMICAIEDHPDPCPTEFEGVYWSYWYADTTGDAAGEWQQYMEGSDTAVTQEGRVEGWRYGDGSEGPRVDPLALAAAGDAAQDEDETTDEATDEPAHEPVDGTEAPTAGADGATQDDEATEATEADTADQDAAPVWPWVAGGAVVLVLVALLVRSRRATADTTGAGDDGDEV